VRDSSAPDLLDVVGTPVRWLWTRPLSLRAKLILAALLVAVPSFILSLVGLYNVVQEQRALMPRADLVSATAQANLVDATIDGAIGVAWAIAESPAAQTLDPGVLGPMLTRLQPAETGITNLIVFDAGGRSVAEMARTGGPPLGLGGPAFLQGVLAQNGPVASGVQTDPASGHPAVFVGVPIRGAGATPGGAVVAVVDLSVLQDRLPIDPSSPDRVVLVLDPSGQVAVAKGVAVPNGTTNLGTAPLIRKARASGAATQAASALPPLNGSWLGAARVSPRYHWIVVVLQPTSTVLEGLTPAVWLEVASLLLAVALAAIAALYVSRRIIGPVHALQRTSEAWSRGEMNRRAAIPGSDELAALGTSFNEMASSLSGTMERLTSADERLESERNRLQAILNTSPVGIVVMNAREQITLANPAAEALLGEAMAPSRPARDYRVVARMFHPNGAPYAYDDLPIVRALRTGETIVGDEVVIHHANGWEEHLLVNAAPVRDPSGKIVGSVAVFFDVTPLAEEQRLRSEFIVSAAQEFRNPLTVIKGYAEVAMRDPIVHGTAVYGELERILRAANRLAALSDQVIHASQVHLPALILRREPLNLADLVARTTREFENANGTGKYRIALDTHPVAVEGDPKLLSEALADLLRAAEASMPDGGKIEVRVSGWDGIATLSVTDHGPIVPQERIAGLFQAFSLPGHETNEPSSRLSLPLYLAKRIIEESGGWVRAQSAKEGTTIYVTLPRQSGAEATADGKAVDQQRAPARSSLRLGERP
jgi:two-component system phosphate regulon sensor histidine kinase PhoR